MSRYPTGPFSTHRTGCYGCFRMTSSDGGCGVSGYPCTHWGMDLFAGSRNVVAPEAGEVVAVATGSSPPWSGYGPGVVVIKGVSGKYLLMGHLTYGSIEVDKGQIVKEGDPIALYDPGIAHTHFEVRHELTGDSATNTMDPAMWLRGERAITAFKLTGLAAAAYFGARWIARGVGRGQ